MSILSTLYDLCIQQLISHLIDFADNETFVQVTKSYMRFFFLLMQYNILFSVSPTPKKKIKRKEYLIDLVRWKVDGLKTVSLQVIHSVLNPLTWRWGYRIIHFPCLMLFILISFVSNTNSDYTTRFLYRYLNMISYWSIASFLSSRVISLTLNFSHF